MRLWSCWWVFRYTAKPVYYYIVFYANAKGIFKFRVCWYDNLIMGCQIRVLPSHTSVGSLGPISVTALGIR